MYDEYLFNDIFSYQYLLELRKDLKNDSQTF